MNLIQKTSMEKGYHALKGKVLSMIEDPQENTTAIKYEIPTNIENGMYRSMHFWSISVSFFSADST